MTSSYNSLSNWIQAVGMHGATCWPAEIIFIACTVAHDLFSFTPFFYMPLLIWARIFRSADRIVKIIIFNWFLLWINVYNSSYIPFTTVTPPSKTLPLNFNLFTVIPVDTFHQPCRSLIHVYSTLHTSKLLSEALHTNSCKHAETSLLCTNSNSNYKINYARNLELQSNKIHTKRKTK